MSDEQKKQVQNDQIAEDLFALNDDESTEQFLENKKKNSDGIYRPSYKDAKDPREGYKATIRFLPNLSKDGKIKPFGIEKHLHYAKLTNNPELKGYYSCKKNFENDCPICDLYWEYYNSKNAVENEKAKMIKRNTKYYSYVYIVEDENRPELEGKIMVYSYGYKIREKIQAQWKGEIDGKKIKVHDLANGKDFKLIVKKNSTPEGDFPNYDSSQFLERSPIKINGKKLPAEWSEEHQKYVVTNPKVKKQITNFLLNREHDIEEFEAEPWDEATANKVNQILSVVKGEDVENAKQSIENASNENASSNIKESDENDDFFNGSDEKEEDEDFFKLED